MERSVSRDSARSPEPQSSPPQATTSTTQQSTTAHVIGPHPLSTSGPATASHTTRAGDQCTHQSARRHTAAALHKGSSYPLSGAPTSPPPPQASPPVSTAAATSTNRVPDGPPFVPPSSSGLNETEKQLPEHRPVQRTQSTLRSAQRPSNLHSSAGGSAGARRRLDRPKSVRLVVGNITEGGSGNQSPAEDRRDSHRQSAKDKQQVGEESGDLSCVRRGQSLDRERDRPAFFVRFLKRRSTSSKFTASHAKQRGSLPVATAAGTQSHQQHHVFYSPRISSGHHQITNRNSRHNQYAQQQHLSLPHASGTSSFSPAPSPLWAARRGSSPHVRLQSGVAIFTSGVDANHSHSPARHTSCTTSPRSPRSPRSKSAALPPAANSLSRSVSSVQPYYRKRITTAPATPGDGHTPVTSTSSHPTHGSSATVKHSVSVTFAERPTTLFEGAQRRQPARGMEERRSSLARLVSIRRPTTSSSEYGSGGLLSNDQWDLDRSAGGGQGASGGAGTSAAAAQWEALERMFTRASLRVAVVGPRRAGKSALVERFVRDEFSDHYTPTRSPRLSLPVLVTSCHMFHVQLLDVPPQCCSSHGGGSADGGTAGDVGDNGLGAHCSSDGHLSDRSQRTSFCGMCGLAAEDADAFVLVFDASSPESFRELNMFRERLLAERPDATILVAAAKVDLLPAYRKNAWMEARRAQLSACMSRGLASDPEVSRKSSDNDDARHSRLNLAALNLKDAAPSSASQPPRSRTTLGLDTLAAASGAASGGGGAASGGGGSSSTSLMQRLRKMSTSRSAASELHALARPPSSAGGLGLGIGLAIGRRDASHHDGLVSLFVAHSALLHSAAVPQSTSPHLLPHAFHMAHSYNNIVKRYNAAVGGSKANRMLGLDAFTIVRKHWKLELVECSARHNFHVTHVFRELVTLVEAAQARAADAEKRAAAAAKRPRTPLGLGLRADRCRVS